ncbi:unnamed protein product [Rotaria sordida]|uniref:Methyltransferase domain-containing protein n=1 Tax=Rotaria sordida TaxID=392033 RepID=A0A815G3T7_9BILA|nr:unnamed protein product [Rotaria sordida]CAF1349300.1 unnamed protein product [Rotaria sordida]CAF4024547.1 unnamed protein product [Rotaria sordida]CAF4074406.1 unnamed protein product [Rotaria sordida]
MSDSPVDQHETKRNYFTPAISSKYVGTFFNSPLHNEWMSSLIYDSLELQPNHMLVDMGCGPGVDPSQGMLDEFRKGSDSNPNIEAVCMDAVTFSQSPQYSSYDRIFMKLMIHLLTDEERLIAFQGFYKQLAPTKGKLLIIRRLHTAEISPFDERTKSLFGNLKVETLFDELKHVGFKQIQQETFTFEYPPNSVKAEDWIYLIENRLWTELSEKNINEQQMKDLIDHVRRQYETPNNFQTIDKATIIKCCVE